MIMQSPQAVAAAIYWYIYKPIKLVRVLLTSRHAISLWHAPTRAAIAVIGNGNREIQHAFGLLLGMCMGWVP